MSATIKLSLNSLVLAASLACATAAMAHAQLKTQTPAANSSGAAPADLRLGFSEGVEPSFTKVEVSDNGQAVAIKTIATDPADNTLLIVTPAQPLKPGAYKVDWHAVSVDSHKSQGSYSFMIAN